MQAPIALGRLSAGLLALLCAALVVWASLQGVHTLAEARAERLEAVESAVARSATGLIEQERISKRLVRVVEAQIVDPDLGIRFLTLRNAADVTLVSRGRLGQTALDWIPMADGRALRSWVYRVSSAQANRPLVRDGRRIGSAHFGVAWTRVAYQAGFPLFVWASALLAGLIGLAGAIVRLRPSHASHTQPTAASAVAAGRGASTQDSVAGATTATARRSRSRSGRRRSPEREFTPIGDASAGTPVSAPEPDRAAKHEASNASPRAAFSHVPTERVPTASGDEAAPSVGADTSTPVFEAPRVDAKPALGDNTLDLRFYPIWRGQNDNRRLAGAYAAMAWRAGDAELVSPETLIQLAERDGALRAFTQWIARRLSLLHANWRTLELATVPIVLPIPSAMLGFADAEVVWREALRRTDRDSDDLILALDSDTASAYTALPVRRILPLAGPELESPRDCDVLGVTEPLIQGNTSAWRARVDALACPVLFGPLEAPERYQELLARPRALWFSNRVEEAHSPRSFARLLMLHATAPIL